MFRDLCGNCGEAYCRPGLRRGKEVGADTEFPRRWNWSCVVEVMTGVSPRVGWNCWLGPSRIGCEKTWILFWMG